MDEISTNIKDRILEIAQRKKLNKAKFIEELNQKYSNYRGVSRKSSPSADVIAEISTKHTDINIDWVLTGRGEMFKQHEPNQQHFSGSESDHTGTHLIPLLSFSELEALGSDNILAPQHAPTYQVPEFEQGNIEVLLRMSGDAMQPTYRSGDLLGCRRLPLDAFFQWNKVYALSTTQGLLIRRIQQSSNPGYLTCLSDNTQYPPFDIKLNTDVSAIAIVLGAIRME